MRLRIPHAHVLLALSFLVFLDTPLEAQESGYYTHPTITGDQVVFVSEGDLFSAVLSNTNEQGTILAHRLTSSDGSESDPILSPNGQWVAFSGEYDGNTDIYVMPVAGGSPQRLTFHPATDRAVAWSPDGQRILFRTARAHPLDRDELMSISRAGGMPERLPFGEGTQASFSSSGNQLAFTPHSNEDWTWKRYRGGTAPDIWVANLVGGSYTKLTESDANDMYPMWMQGRVYFLSDRGGTPNIFSMSPNGEDLKQHTTMVASNDLSQGVRAHDIRWPSHDAKPGGNQIIFSQGGQLGRFTTDERVEHLPIAIASDRVASRPRHVALEENMTSFALSPAGDEILVEARGELVMVPVDGTARRLTRTSGVREWGATFVTEDELLIITDRSGEQQLALLSTSGDESPMGLTDLLDKWIYPPQMSPDGQWIAYGDKTFALYVTNMSLLEPIKVATDSQQPMTDYRFSPDSKWLAYAQTLDTGVSQIYLLNLDTRKKFTISDGLHSDSQPRWDPAGLYLYFVSGRDLSAAMGSLDFQHVHDATDRLVAVPLAEHTPPPDSKAMQSVEFDVDYWSMPPMWSDFDEEVDDEEDFDEELPIEIDPEGLSRRHYTFATPAGSYAGLEATWGGLLYVNEPGERLDQQEQADWMELNMAGGKYGIMKLDAIDGEPELIAPGVGEFAINMDRNMIAYSGDMGMAVLDLETRDELPVDLSMEQLHVDIPSEWSHMFEEAWRRQRDFFWAPNMGGIDWDAVGAKYRAVLPQIGSREELNDLIGEMYGELQASHAYIGGGDPADWADYIDVGLLGIDGHAERDGFRIDRILPAQGWTSDAASPLDAAWQDVSEGDLIVAINGQPVSAHSNIYKHLQGQAGKTVRLSLRDKNQDDDPMSESRVIEVEALADEMTLRYLDWVENNRQMVAEATDGQVGYLHIPDMDGLGLTMFSRYYYPQIKKDALIIDIRNNGGGFVSQMIIERLAREVLGYDSIRHGIDMTYPWCTFEGPMVALIDQHAGSDGDIFPAMFRRKQLGPLIGTRTWGGVIGISEGVPFLDGGYHTQPEAAWWEAEGGWTLENRGVEPDIEVALTPSDRDANADPQLDMGIQEAMRLLQTQATEKPARPPYPTEPMPGQ